MPKIFARQNLQHTNPNGQSWSIYQSPMAAAVKAVYTDAAGRTRVNALYVRSGLPVRAAYAQTPCVSVGDWGYVIYPDARRDTPVFVSAIPVNQLLQSASVQAVNDNSVDVLLTVTQQTLVRIPYLIASAQVPAGDLVQTTQPSVGDKGAVLYLDGSTTNPVYLGRLSAT